MSRARSRASRARSIRSRSWTTASSARLRSRSAWRATSRRDSDEIRTWSPLMRRVQAAMSDASTCSVPFLRPIFERVASILPWIWLSDCPPEGTATIAPPRTHDITQATRMRRRIGGRGPYDARHESPAKPDAHGGLGPADQHCHNKGTMRPTSFGRDTGLQVRMLITFFLLGALYVVFIGVLVTAGAGGITIALFAGGLLLVQFFFSDKIGLRAAGAREVSPS